MARKSRGLFGNIEDSNEQGNGSIESHTESDESIPKKRASFSRLASIRVSRAIDAMTQLTNLANTSSYDWVPEDTDKIFNTLRSKLNEVEASFIAAKQPREKKAKVDKQLSFRL